MQPDKLLINQIIKVTFNFAFKAPAALTEITFNELARYQRSQIYLNVKFNVEDHLVSSYKFCNNSRKWQI